MSSKVVLGPDGRLIALLYQPKLFETIYESRFYLRLLIKSAYQGVSHEVLLKYFNRFKKYCALSCIHV